MNFYPLPDLLQTAFNRVSVGRCVTGITVCRATPQDNSHRSYGSLHRVAGSVCVVAGSGCEGVFKVRTTVIHCSVGLVLTAITSLGMADTVYRGVDSDGQPIYADRPLAGYQETFELDILHSSSEAIRQRQAANAEASKIAGIRESQDEQISKEAAATDAAIAAQNAANCAAAKERAEKYNSHRKLYKPLPNGEREYLSDEELDAARAEAASTVAEWCS